MHYPTIYNDVTSFCVLAFSLFLLPSFSDYWCSVVTKTFYFVVIVHPAYNFFASLCAFQPYPAWKFVWHLDNSHCYRTVLTISATYHCFLFSLYLNNEPQCQLYPYLTVFISLHTLQSSLTISCWLLPQFMALLALIMVMLFWAQEILAWAQQFH
jgi:hypothetical protein